jgi:hypothetical protein
MDTMKLLKMEARHDYLAGLLRAGRDSYRTRIESSKYLRSEAVALAEPEAQTMTLQALLALTDDQLAAAGVEVVTLRRAGIERHLADGVLQTDPAINAEFAALSTLLPKLRNHIGTPA